MLSNAQLGSNAAITLNACDTGITEPGQGPPIAQVISNQLGRGVYGYAVGMYFSSYNPASDPSRTGAGKNALSDLPVYMVPEGPPGNKPLANTIRAKLTYREKKYEKVIAARCCRCGHNLFGIYERNGNHVPQDVVDKFVKMDVEGERLTPEGWHIKLMLSS